MLDRLLSVVLPDALKIALVLALALFLGLEREGHKQREATYAFGGVTTFPVIGLVSYSLALVSGPGLIPWVVGFAAVSGFMLLSYRHKLAGELPAGVITEMSALATYVLGALVQREHYWIATTVGVLTVLIVELKKSLDGLTRLVASNEIVTAAKFLVLAAVILPIVPDQALTRFHINPFSTWLVVVAVSGVSFGSFVLQRLLVGRGGVLLSAVLGGAYSSTVPRSDRFGGDLARDRRGGDHGRGGEQQCHQGVLRARVCRSSHRTPLPRPAGRPRRAGLGSARLGLSGEPQYRILQNEKRRAGASPAGRVREAAMAFDLHSLATMARTADKWWMMVARGLASFGLAGVLLLGAGWSSLPMLAAAFAIWALVDGAGSLTFVSRMREVRIATYVGRGCLGIAVGALALVLARSSTTALYALVAAWAIGTGALEMAFASRSWFVLPRALGFMLVGGVSLGFGLSLLPFPLETVTSLRLFLVAFALLNGVAALFMGEELHAPPRHVHPSRAS